jgi:hypothetical protein
MITKLILAFTKIARYGKQPTLLDLKSPPQDIVVLPPLPLQPN